MTNILSISKVDNYPVGAAVKDLSTLPVTRFKRMEHLEPEYAHVHRYDELLEGAVMGVHDSYEYQR